MSFWAVVFIVLMLLWLFGGCAWGWDQTKPSVVLGGTILPWACVAILGYIVLTGQAVLR